MSKYFVWRRLPDGLVSSSAGQLPRGWSYRSDFGEVVNVTFESLLETDDWAEAHDRIVAERQKAETPPNKEDSRD